ncbi:MAG: sensor domain-containing diguanylate cyclase [Burkholderiales bacterium]
MKYINPARFEELNASGQLPSPKGVALALLDLVRQDDFGLADVTHIVQSDPALAGRLLRLANAAGRGVRRPVVALPEAVMVIGLPMTCKIALGLSVLAESQQGECKAFDYQRFWSLSLATAITCQWLGFRSQMAGDETFTCGLLGQVGRLALASIFPDRYGEVLKFAAGKSEAELLRLEQEHFATDHRELTAAILSNWGVPQVLVEAVYYHENPAEANFQEGSRLYLLSHSQHFAAYLAQVCLADEAERQPMLSNLYVLGARLGLDADAVGALSDQVVAEWQDWGAILDVPTQVLPPFAEMADALPQVPPVSDTSVGAKGQECSFPLRILVVDDSLSIRNLLAKMLSAAGHAVATAANGKDALGRVVDFNPQLIITDWVMPEMDGLALCKAVRLKKSACMPYLIMLTVLEDEARLIEAFEAGADDYVVKPMSERALMARLRAGQRVIQLQEEILREREELRRSAAELAVTNRRLLDAAMTDSLTLLPNRRYGMERFEQAWAATSRSKQTLSCILLDLDHFKKINDTYGHATGDKVLQLFSRLLEKAMRQEDVACRLGGEEFMVICQNTDLPGAIQTAERIRRQVEAEVFADGELSLRVTVSAGVATRDSGMPDSATLLKMADQALYAAKQAGRNRVVVFRRREST